MKKKILWVKTDAMLPLDKGGKIRSFNMLKHIASKVDVDYLCFASEDLKQDDRKQLKAMFHDFVEVPPFDPDNMNWKYLLNLIVAHARGIPFTLHNYHHTSMTEKIEMLQNDNAYDALICDFLGPALNFPLPLRKKSVLFQHNVEHVLWERQTQQEKRLLRKKIYSREYRLVEQFENKLCTEFQQVVCVSEEDAAVLRKSCDVKRIHSIDTGVDIDYFTPSADRTTDGQQIVFTGSMDWLPNIDAMSWFVDEIFPLLKKTFPNVKLSIVGRNPTPSIRNLGEKDASITVSGKVPDVRPWMNRSDIFIVPIRVGGGTRLKIYEAMAMGLPVVSTTIGAEGLKYVPDENILIADDAAEFVQSLVKLLNDTDLGNTIGKAARRFVVENYSWSRIADQFLDFAIHNNSVDN